MWSLTRAAAVALCAQAGMLAQAAEPRPIAIDLAFLHGQRYVVQRLDRPVARGHVAQVEERAHYDASSSSPPRDTRARRLPSGWG